MKENLFPYKTIRPVQDNLLDEIYSAFKNKKNLIVHAPTGLGKTAAALSPALSFALKKDLTIFFLTSRHTQHHLAIETLKDIKEKHNINIDSVDIIGKQWMCIQEHVTELYSNEFNEYCKAVREKHECEFYENTRKRDTKVTPEAKRVLEEIKKISPCHSEQIIEICKKEKLCPYEISTLLARDAKVIIADYYYIFHPTISDYFFKKTNKKLEDSIIIVDEAHNLPSRMRNLLTQKLSNFILDNAIREAKKYKYDELIAKLKHIKYILEGLADRIKGYGKEILISKKEFIDKVKEIDDYDILITDFEFAADDIREKQRASYIGSVASFLNKWLGGDKGFARILSYAETKQKPYISLSYRCLDPSLLSTVVVENSFSTIMMSGTLTPTNMYSDLLGFNKDTVQKEFTSPFPEKNRLTLVIPETTTKFTRRNEEQYRRIAEICSSITNIINGNSAIFFPSYMLMNDVNKFFLEFSDKEVIAEQPGMSKEAKHDVLERFKERSNKGAVLLGVASGSFGEGIDLPGDFLKAVIVVGIPLQKPDLEVGELIKYYDEKFGKGWDYGYIFPAILKSMQNAGRCIRSETDKGVVVFLDERFALEKYKKCFSKEMNAKITRDYIREIKDFFENV